MKDYILFVYGSVQNQDKFVKNICNRILQVIEGTTVKYYYGNESMIIVIKSDKDLTDLTDGINSIFKKSPNIVYLLLPFEHDNMSYKMTEEASEHLFGTEFNEKIQTEDSYITPNINDFLNFLTEISQDFDVDICDIKVEIIDLPEKTLSLDEILDKINQSGIDSLTETEKKQLEEYSK